MSRDNDIDDVFSVKKPEETNEVSVDPTEYRMLDLTIDKSYGIFDQQPSRMHREGYETSPEIVQAKAEETIRKMVEDNVQMRMLIQRLTITKSRKPKLWKGS